MTDTYSYQGDLQPGGGGRPAHVTVRPPAVPKDSDLEDWSPPPTKGKAETGPLEDWTPTEKEPPAREYSTPEALGRGVTQAASFGLRPAIGGVIAAGGGDPLAEGPDVGALVKGGINMLHNAFSSHPDPEVQAAYERGRQAALTDQDAAKEQHPYAYFSGQLAGSLLAPVGGGAMAPASLGVRALRGGIAGGIGGGAMGAGEAVSEGKGAGEIGQAALKGAAGGAATGAVLGGVLGPRVVNPNSPGQRAARTAEDLGAPLPVGVVSDRPTTQATTSNVMSLPLIGPRIRSRVENTERAAGEHVEGIAGGMAGPATDRASANVAVRPGIQAAIDANRAAQDASYTSLRGQIDPVRELPMPRLTATLNRLEYDRIGAGWAHPGQGFEQFRRLADRGASFNGAHRARVDARNAGNVLSPNPGYNAADFNQITRAITADLRSNVENAALDQTPRGRIGALREFDRAETNFGPLADMNDVLARLRDAGREGGIATLLNAAKERGGDLQLLGQLRRSMPPAQFDVIGGLLLSELGYSAGRGEFSLSQFSTNFNKLSDGAVRTLFSPQHAANLRAIADMGEHIKQALKTASTSHSSNWLAFVDIVKDVALLGHDLGASGGFGKETAVGLGSTGVLYGLGWMLGNPARTASLSTWMRAYRGFSGTPTPARTATFKIATRNLANTLGVPIDKLMGIITDRLSGVPTADDNGQH